MIFRPLRATMGRAGSVVGAKGRRVKPPRSVIFRRIMEEKRRRRTTSTGSLDGSMITKDNCLVRLDASDSVVNSLRVIPEHEAEYAPGSETEVRRRCVKPKFQLARHVTSRYDTYDVSSVSSRACSNMADDEEAEVLAHRTSSVLCALDLHQSQKQLMEKSEAGMSIRVHAVATPLNTCRASRACRVSRDERVAPCCPTSATRSSRLFPNPKCMG